MDASFGASGSSEIRGFFFFSTLLGSYQRHITLVRFNTPPAGPRSSGSSLLSARSTPKKLACLFAWIDATVPSSSPITAPRLLSTAMKTPPDECLRSSLPTFSSVILAASAANLHHSLASLLKRSSISSFLNLCSIPKKLSHKNYRKIVTGLIDLQ